MLYLRGFYTHIYIVLIRVSKLVVYGRKFNTHVATAIYQVYLSRIHIISDRTEKLFIIGRHNGGQASWLPRKVTREKKLGIA